MRLGAGCDVFAATSFSIPRAKRSNSVQEVRDRETHALPRRKSASGIFANQSALSQGLTANQKQDETSETRQINVEDLLMNLFIRVHSCLNATRIMKMTRDV